MVPEAQQSAPFVLYPARIENLIHLCKCAVIAVRTSGSRKNVRGVREMPRSRHVGVVLPRAWREERGRERASTLANVTSQGKSVQRHSYRYLPEMKLWRWRDPQSRWRRSCTVPRNGARERDEKAKKSLSYEGHAWGGIRSDLMRGVGMNSRRTPVTSRAQASARARLV